LELVVEDADGAVVFASGRTDSTGRLVDGAGQVLPSETAGGAILGHLQTLTSSDQVYVLEAIMANQSGNPTFTLLRAASYAKDNRLLPRGWSDQYSKIAQIAPVGTDGDADFTGGGDQLDIDLALASDGQLTVRARLLYQPVSARFLAELARWDTPEIRAFLTMLRAVGPSPEVVAEAQLTNE
ncbi:MAG: hypothetical protein KJO07_22105, partial [Deltaproteobacteria bacterium]|nr:hypothetical protein [Deltaproteobacteria bacterium]